MLSVIITVVHVVACVFLVLVVLLQTGKGAEMGAVFGGSSSTVFGSSGAGNFLTKLTTATAIIFMLTSLTLTYLGARQETETIFDTAPLAEPAAPAAPAAGAGEQAAPAPPAPVEAPAAAAPEPAAPAAPAPEAAALAPAGEPAAPAEAAPAAEQAPPEAAPAPIEQPAAEQPQQ